MSRMPRAVLPGVPHHLTQRGVNRQRVFFSEQDHRIYLDVVVRAAEESGVSLIGYCLMPNHVHWVVIPEKPDSLARAFGRAHNRYANWGNAQFQRSGHFWQNRFFSCALDDAHLCAALRYVELNPARSGLVDAATDWPWSRAAAHVGRGPAPKWLDLSQWQWRYGAVEWSVYLSAPTVTDAAQILRANTYTGRPVGTPEFVKRAEAELGRTLQPSKPGRKPKTRTAAGSIQPLLFDQGN